MKKLALKMDDLRVESFPTAVDLTALAGTVRGLDTHNQANSDCWGTGCDQSLYDGDACAGGITNEPTGSNCYTLTQGNDDTCINCTARMALCTEEYYFCYVVSEGTCWTQDNCCP